MKLNLLFAGLLASSTLSIAQIPTLEWANAMGSATSDVSRCVAVDASGNVYTAGDFTGTADLDPSAGTDNHTSAGSNDIFVTKFSPTGAFVWARSIGGTGIDNGNAIAVDASGNVYIAGSYENTVDFDPEGGSFPLTSNGSYEIFIMKLTTGGSLSWAKSIGSVGDDAVMAISLGPLNDVYTTGYFSITADFDPNGGVDNLTVAGGYDIFVNRLDASGNYVWTKQFGGTNYDIGNSIAVDALGNIFTTGYYSGTADFDPGAGSYPYTSSGSNDAFVSKLYPSGNFAWAVSFGTTTAEYSYDIALDGSGNIFTTGRFDGTVDFDPGAGSFPMTSAGSRDVYISKLDTAGVFVWAKQVGTTNIEVGYSVEADAAGNLYATGTFGNVPIDMDPGPGSYILTAAGGTETFILKLDASGTFSWAIQFAGTSADQINDLTLDAAGNIYACGYFGATGDFDPGPGTFNLTATAGGLGDAFSIKLNPGVSTGMDPNDMKEQAIVYPNPSDGHFSILHDSEISTIRIMNVLGELVFSDSNQNGIQTTIDLSAEANGIYFYQLESKGKITATGKIIKK